METVKLYDGLKCHHGSITELAKRAGLSRGYVTCVLAGKYRNLNVTRIGAELLKELMAEVNEVKDLVEEATSLH
jgi:DNA-binding MarR family transcriptional regulator